jgi:hypothetical protein
MLGEPSFALSSPHEIQMDPHCLLNWPHADAVGVAGLPKHSFYGPTQQSVVTTDGQRDSPAELWETRKTAPLALDFPVLIAQLPYILGARQSESAFPKECFPTFGVP